MIRRELTLTWNTRTGALTGPAVPYLMREEPLTLIVVTDRDIATPDLIVTVKLAGDGDSDPLLQFTGFTRLAYGKFTVTGLVSSAGINTALGVDGSAANDTPQKSCDLQIRLRESSAEAAKSDKFVITLKNDTSRPADLTPQALPTPDGWLDARVPRKDKSLPLTDPEKAFFWANVGSAVDSTARTAAAAALARANHTGTQAIATVTGLQAALDANAAAITAAVAGLDLKASCRVATTANITIATALNHGDTLDGITLATGDRVLVKNQSSAAQNGIYIVGASPARATDFDAWLEIPGALVAVEVGTAGADTVWLCSADQGGTLGSTAITFTQFGGGGGATYTLLANAVLRRALIGVNVGDIVEQEDSYHRWLACDLAVLTMDAGWQDLGITIPGPLLYSGGTVTPDVSGWTITGGRALVKDGNIYVSAAATAVATDTNALDGTFDATAFPALTSLTVNSSGITVAPVIAGLSALTTLNLSGTAITSLGSIELPIATLNCSNCASLSSLSIGYLFATLLSLNFSGCALPDNVNGVPGVLSGLVAGGLTDGYVNLSGGTSAAVVAESAAAADVATLLSRGWTVITN